MYHIVRRQKMRGDSLDPFARWHDRVANGERARRVIDRIAEWNSGWVSASSSKNCNCVTVTGLQPPRCSPVLDAAATELKSIAVVSITDKFYDVVGIDFALSFLTDVSPASYSSVFSARFTPKPLILGVHRTNTRLNTLADVQMSRLMQVRISPAD